MQRPTGNTAGDILTPDMEASSGSGFFQTIRGPIIASATAQRCGSPCRVRLPSLEAVLDEAKRSAEVTHNHPEGIKGAQATAAAVFLAREGESKEGIQSL